MILITVKKKQQLSQLLLRMAALAVLVYMLFQCIFS